MLITINRGLAEFEQTISIRRNDPHRHKFADALAEYLDMRLADNMERSDGDVECPTGAWIRCGRRILFYDERGFVWVETYPDEAKAEAMEKLLSDYYGWWGDEECDQDEIASNLARIDAEMLALANSRKKGP